MWYVLSSIAAGMRACSVYFGRTDTVEHSGCVVVVVHSVKAGTDWVGSWLSINQGTGEGTVGLGLCGIGSGIFLEPLLLLLFGHSTTQSVDKREREKRASLLRVWLVPGLACLPPTPPRRKT